MVGQPSGVDTREKLGGRGGGGSRTCNASWENARSKTEKEDNFLCIRFTHPVVVIRIIIFCLLFTFSLTLFKMSIEYWKKKKEKGSSCLKRVFYDFFINHG